MPSAATIRQRVHRAREASGRAVLQVAPKIEPITDWLIEQGHITDEFASEDPAKVEAGLQLFLDDLAYALEHGMRVRLVVSRVT